LLLDSQQVSNFDLILLVAHVVVDDTHPGLADDPQSPRPIQS
jgi:hypothetical protein